MEDFSWTAHTIIKTDSGFNTNVFVSCNIRHFLMKAVKEMMKNLGCLNAKIIKAVLLFWKKSNITILTIFVLNHIMILVV